MPWDSLRKRLSTDSSSGTKKRDQQDRSPKSDQHAFANVVNQVVVNRTRDQYSSSSSQPASISKSSGRLSPEIYQKIKEVDQEASTLTAAGVKGLSTRVIERQEYSHPSSDGAPQPYYCQTVEIIKRPGQSLGLYLREGNGEDRYDGVFVSRLQEGSELEKSGVLRVGDEILTVNKVNVTKRNIDEVVVMISIPRRLLLQIRSEIKRSGYGSSARRMNEEHDSGKFIKPIDSRTTIGANKPIAVVKQLPRDESRESTTTDDGAPLASAQIMPTAQTSLGVKARAQAAYGANEYGATSFTRVPATAQRTFSSVSGTGHQPRPRDRNPITQRSLSERWSQNRQYPVYNQSGIADVEDRPFPVGSVCVSGSSNPRWSGDYASESNPTGYQSTLANTAYLPPPRLQGHLSTLERATSRTNPGGSGTVDDPYRTPMPPSMWDQSSGPVEYADSSLFSPRSVASDSRLTTNPVQHGQPRSALRQPSAFPTSVFPSVKSNSLPRRNVSGRTIKWRNDVPIGGSDAPTSVSNPRMGEASDSDGAVSMPETALSPRGVNVPNPVYALPRTPTSGKTIDDVFSRAQYRAWDRVPDQYEVTGASNVCGYPAERVYVQPYTQQRQFPGYDPADSYQGIIGRIPSGGESEHWTHRSRDQQPSYNVGAGYFGHSVGRGSKNRSSSLPPRGGVLQYRDGASIGCGADGGRLDETVDPMSSTGPLERNVEGNRGYVLDVSPLPRRRLPLSLAATNPSFGYPVPTLVPSLESGVEASSAWLTGILFLRIIEGRHIRARDAEEMYCVVEVDGEHRARTEVSDWQSAFHWNELFEIDVWECRRADLYVYSWHPEYRHRLRHRGFIQLMSTLLEESGFNIDQESMIHRAAGTGHSFALSLDPHGQLFIQIGFQSMPAAYRRRLAIRRSSYWGVPLQMLVEREASTASGDGHIPTVFRRLVQEIERRGVDTTGLYVLCGSSSKKHLLKDQLEREPELADLSPDAVPDLNVLTSVFKDFLRELPEPVVPNCTFQMLLEAWRVCAPNDKEGNAKLMLGVIDCLPRMNKCTFMVLMDHLKYVISQSPHNGLSRKKCAVIFGPLVFCTSQAYPLTSAAENTLCQSKPYFSFLDHRLAARLLELLLDLWPSPRTSSESSGSENSTINLTGHGNTSLVDLWLQENRFPESNC